MLLLLLLLLVLIEAAAIAGPRLLVLGLGVVAAPGPWLRPVLLEEVAAVVEDAPAMVLCVSPWL